MSIVDDDLVSIITPAYRVEKIVQDTIDSVKSQTYRHWEMLVADDCSPDETASVISAAAATDPRVRLIPCNINGGPAAARNAALAQARGRWIAFLDSDDLWLPEKLEETIRHAVENRSALTYTGFRRISYDGVETGGYISVPKSLTYQQLLGNTAIATSTVLVDRRLIGDISMKKVYYDDFVCWLEILKKGFEAHGLNKDLMRYRVVANSISRNKRRSAAEVWKTYRQVENLGFVTSAWYFSRYAFNALAKYWKF
jgi:teichuronic acid biosynthesis glycosyltransferase TuaG